MPVSMEWLLAKYSRRLRLKSSPYGLHISGYTRVTMAGTISSIKEI